MSFWAKWAMAIAVELEEALADLKADPMDEMLWYRNRQNPVPEQATL